LPLRKIARTDDIQRSVGNRIRALRRKYGWSQEEFAGQCGLHRTYMGHVERGEKNISLSTMVRISDALGIRLRDLFAASTSQLGAKWKPARKAGSQTGPNFGVAAIGPIVAELRTERNALKQAVRDLMQVSRRLANRVR
jgi:transcriptional regulator with XRE-family HTH domain